LGDSRIGEKKHKLTLNLENFILRWRFENKADIETNKVIQLYFPKEEEDAKTVATAATTT
jgi:hypothetical protein